MQLADLFMRHQSRSVIWRGTCVHGLFEVDIKSNRLVVCRSRSKADPVQGIAIDLSREGEICGHRGKEFVLWSDTISSLVEVNMTSTEATKLKVWNVWKGPYGVTQAWIGNAGMLVEERDNGAKLRCSDGLGDPTFSDLVVTLEW